MHIYNISFTQEGRVEIINKTVPHPTHRKGILLLSLLRIINVDNATDRGIYKCIATDHSSNATGKRTVNVLGKFAEIIFKF